MWRDIDLSQASFRQIEFDFVDVEDGFKKTLAKYDYPYADGSDLEDMGLEARTVRLRAVFWGEKYNNLRPFIEALKESGPGEVVHPVFGRFQAGPETVSIRHDERAYHAEVDVTFIEQRDLSVVTPVSAAGVKLTLGMDEVLTTEKHTEDLLGKALKDSGVPQDIPTAGLGGAGYMATIAGYASKVRETMRKVDSAVSVVKGYVNQATEPFSLITSAVSFSTGLPGRVLGHIAGGIESVAGAYRSLLDAPGRFIDSLNYGLSKMEAALGSFEGDKSMKASWHVSKASALAVAASIELAVDEAAEGGRSIGLKEFGYEGSASRARLMTIDEIDSVATLARKSINAALAAARDAYGESGYDLELSLKAQALNVQETADAVRLRRERIVDYEVKSDASLHMIAFNLYGDIDKAERLLRINNIRNPNFIRSGTHLRVYA